MKMKLYSKKKVDSHATERLKEINMNTVRYLTLRQERQFNHLTVTPLFDFLPIIMSDRVNFTLSTLPTLP